jgi:hypothetical protein
METCPNPADALTKANLADAARLASFTTNIVWRIEVAKQEIQRDNIAAGTAKLGPQLH